MKLKGVTLFFLYCPPERQREFNLWYDLDHIPENRALPGVFHAERNVATADCLALREVSLLDEGGGYYQSVYFSENDPMVTSKDISRLGARLRPRGRFIDCIKSLFGATYRADAVAARPGLLLDPDAVPLLPHQGVYVTLDEIEDPSQEEKLVDWYEKVHIPDTLACRGFAAAIRLHGLTPGAENRMLHYFLLDDDPARAALERKLHLVEWQARGRMAGFAAAARRLFSGPYRTIVPMQHDFIST